MKLLINNLRGINSPAKRRDALQLARGRTGIHTNGEYDIILFQEVRLSNEKLNTLKSEWGQRGNTDRTFLSGTVDDARRGGVLTLFNNKLDIQHIDTKVVAGHAVLNLFKKHGKIFLIGNIYGNPKADDNESRNVLLSIAQKMEEIQEDVEPDYIVLGGDWNCVTRNEDTTTATRKPRTESVLNDLLNTYNLVDLFLHKKPNPTLTWVSDGNPHRRARHDRIYVSPNLLHNSAAKNSLSTTDHMALKVHLLKTKKGIPDWKFDDSLLTDVVFTEKLNNALRDIIVPHMIQDEDGQSPQTIPTEELQKYLNYEQQKPEFILQAITTRIIEVSKQHMTQRRKKRQEKDKSMHEEYIAAKTELVEDPDSEDARERMNNATINLHRERSKKAAEAALRTKIKLTEEGDKPTSYFLSLAKKVATGRDINNIQVNDANGNTQRLQGIEIVQHMTQRYKTIITETDPPQTTIEEFLGNVTQKIQKVPDQFIQILEAPFGEQELERTVQDMKNQSAPGPLGISNMLLKKIFPAISKLAVEVGNTLLRNNGEREVPEWITARDIIFVLKPGKPADDPDSYRGISLLNNMYKIYAATLAKRMSLVMPHVVHQAQKGYIRGKSAAENVRGISDSLKLAHRHQLQWVVLQTDYSKAFPSISKQHIENVLRIHGFPQLFITMIKQLTRISPMKVQINGFKSDTMYAEKGTGQGDPLSSHLYDLAANPLNVLLAESPEVPRPIIPGQDDQLTLEAYADDNAIPLRADIPGIIRTIDIITSFKDVSGLELSPKKCVLIFSTACSDDFQNQLLAQTEMKKANHIRYLGLQISNTGEISDQLNLTPVHEKIKHQSNAIAWRHTSPLGKAIQVKSLLCSRYTHILQSTAPSANWLKTLWDTTRNIIWTKTNSEGTTMRIEISKKRVNQPIKFGGLNLTKPETITKSLRFIWIRRAIDATSHNTNWRKLIDHLLTEIRRPNLTVHLDLGPKEWLHTGTLLYGLDEYWADTFDAIGQILTVCHDTQPLTWHEESIYGHAHCIDTEHQNSLTYRNLFAREMLQNGLINVGQLFHTNNLGTILPNRLKLRHELEEEYNIALTEWQYRSIVILVRDIRQKQRQALRTPVTKSKKTTLHSLYKAHRKGCRFITTMFCMRERKSWDWGNVAKSFITHTRDGLMSVSQGDFTRGFATIQRAIAIPRDRWLSIQIMNRTVWTNYKEYLSERRRNVARGDNQDINHVALCANCGEQDEHTDHIFTTCSVAKMVWTEMANSLNHALRRVILEPDDPQRDHLPIQFQQPNVTFMKITKLSKSVQDTISDLVVLGKRTIYSARYTLTNPSLETIRRLLQGKLDILTHIRASQALNFSITQACSNYFGI